MPLLPPRPLDRPRPTGNGWYAVKLINLRTGGWFWRGQPFWSDQLSAFEMKFPAPDGYLAELWHWYGPGSQWWRVG